MAPKPNTPGISKFATLLKLRLEGKAIKAAARKALGYHFATKMHICSRCRTAYRVVKAFRSPHECA